MVEHRPKDQNLSSPSTKGSEGRATPDASSPHGISGEHLSSNLVADLRSYNEDRYDSGRGLLSVIDRAADEIERLTAERNAAVECAGDYAALLAERDRLTAERDAEVYHHGETSHSLREMEAERARLTADCDRLLEDLELQRKIDLQIIAEKRRLRAALEYIAAYPKMRQASRIRSIIEYARQAVRGAKLKALQTGPKREVCCEDFPACDCPDPADDIETQ